MTVPLTTIRVARGQIVFCSGCCCGRTDRGRPELPVERLKAAWTAGRLNRVVQLTISGCLGPCDLANVALVITPDRTIWLGGLAGDEVYYRLIAWAGACGEAGQLLDLPAELDAHRFRRFPPATEPACGAPAPKAVEAG